MTNTSAKNTAAAIRRRGRPKKPDKSHSKGQARLSTSRKPPPSPIPTSTNLNNQNASPITTPRTPIPQSTATMTTRRSLLSSQTPNSRKRRRPPPAPSVTNVFTEERLPQTCKEFWSWPVSSWYVGDFDEADLRLTDDRPFRESNHAQKNQSTMPKHYRLQWLEQDAAICAGLAKAPPPVPKSIPLMPYARQKDNTGCARPSPGLASQDGNDVNSKKQSSNRNSRARKSASKCPTKLNSIPRKDSVNAPSSSETSTVIRPRTSAKAPRGRPAGSLVEPKINPNAHFPDNRITAYMRPADGKSALQISPSTPLGQRMVFSPTSEEIRNSQSSSPSQHPSPNNIAMTPFTISPSTHIGSSTEPKVKFSTSETAIEPDSLDEQIQSRRNIRIQIVSPEQPRLMGTLTYSVPVSSKDTLSQPELEKDQTADNSSKIFRNDDIYLDDFELDFRKSNSDFLSSFDDAEYKDDLGYEANRLDDVLETLNSKTKPLRDVALAAVMNEIKKQDAHSAMLSRQKQIMDRLAEISAQKRTKAEAANPEMIKSQGKGRRRSLETVDKYDTVDADAPELGIESSVREEESSNLGERHIEDETPVRPLKRMRQDEEASSTSRQIAHDVAFSIVTDLFSSAVSSVDSSLDINAQPKLETENDSSSLEIESNDPPENPSHPSTSVDASLIVSEILDQIITWSVESSRSKDSPATTAPFDLSKSGLYDDIPEIYENPYSPVQDLKVSNSEVHAFQSKETEVADLSIEPKEETRDTNPINDRDVTKQKSSMHYIIRDTAEGEEKGPIEKRVESKLGGPRNTDKQNLKSLNVSSEEEAEPHHEVVCPTEAFGLDNSKNRLENEQNDPKPEIGDSANVNNSTMRDSETEAMIASLSEKEKTNPSSPCLTDSPVMTTSPCGILPKEEEKEVHVSGKMETPMSPIVNKTVIVHGANQEKNSESKLKFREADMNGRTEWKPKDDIGGSPVSDEDNTGVCSEKKIKAKTAAKSTSQS